MLGIPLVLVIVIGCTALFSVKGFSDYSFFEKYKFHIGAIRSGQHIRIVSSAFLHGDIMHLFFNMFTLYFFAPLVISHLGTLQFLLVYAASLLVGNLVSLYLHNKQNHYSAVGASGAVAGVLYAAILFQPTMKISMMFIPIPIPAFVFGIGYLLFSIYGMKRLRNDGIGHDAHFGGAVGGYATALYFAPHIALHQPIFTALLAIPIVVLLVFHYLGKI